MAFSGADSKVRGLADFRGKVVVVNFWATWCGPCIREMPTLVRLRARLGDEDFAVVALSEDRRGWPVIRPFLDKYDLKGLAVYHDPGGRAARALDVQGLPTTVVFDRAGRELGRLAGIAEWDAPEAVSLLRYFAAR
jgi:thiol-disulfide isomerase/thioredoxin